MELFARRWRTVLAPISPLRERHRATVVPAVDDLGHAAHLSAGGEGGVVSDCIDIGLMDLQVVREARLGFLSGVPDFGAGNARPSEQFFIAADGFHPAGLLADPDGKG